MKFRKSDFETIIETLCKRLKDFGVSVSLENLRNASVRSFHPSKNVVLTDGYTSKSVIKELHKMKLTKRLDLTKQTFANEGESLHLYTIAHSFVIYDKIADIKKPSKRATDKDQTLKQLSLFEPLTKKSNFEILRLEVRLSQKRKMDAVLKKLDFEKNPTFRGIFKKDVCKKIVALYWSDIMKDNLFLFAQTNSAKHVLKKIIGANQGLGVKQMIYLVGLQQLCIDDGIRDLRNFIPDDRTWYRTMKELKALNEIESISNCHSWVRQVSSQIKEFKSLEISHEIKHQGSQEP